MPTKNTKKFNQKQSKKFTTLFCIFKIFRNWVVCSGLSPLIGLCSEVELFFVCHGFGRRPCWYFLVYQNSTQIIWYISLRPSNAWWVCSCVCSKITYSTGLSILNIYNELECIIFYIRGKYSQLRVLSYTVVEREETLFQMLAEWICW